MYVAVLSKEIGGNEMKFMASLHKVQVDNEGESAIILKVPQSDLLSILQLTQLTQTLLEVEVEASDNAVNKESSEEDFN